MARTPAIDVDEWLARCRAADPDGCWVWPGGCSTGGYGRSTVDRTRVYVHDHAYRRFVGPVPAGLELDHLCANRPCANPAHLEPVTHAENIRRGEAPHARNARKTHCPQGHAYDGDNLIVSASGGRWCKICKAEAAARHYEQNREAIITRTRAYYERTKPERAAQQKEYRERNRERIRIAKREWKRAKRARERAARTE